MLLFKLKCGSAESMSSGRKKLEAMKKTSLPATKLLLVHSLQKNNYIIKLVLSVPSPTLSNQLDLDGHFQGFSRNRFFCSIAKN